jgi:hypothetical protein
MMGALSCGVGGQHQRYVSNADGLIVRQLAIAERRGELSRKGGSNARIRLGGAAKNSAQERQHRVRAPLHLSETLSGLLIEFLEDLLEQGAACLERF